eukprot:TRINITY_DN20028_c0_g1_i1.p1 TRINITY_DN20028_c0_g1~~TRINITY_DN20028_c0_g1_i1.p1  ORF type:complete len:454 (-),score=52.72 TRINITY_DN20028_c0_g1_i1:395-1756(-)
MSAAVSLGRKLYFSHFLSTFGDRLWKFATPILMVTVWPGELMPVCIFNLVYYVVVLFAFPIVGRTVDTTDRLHLVRYSTFGQNTCICISSALLLVLGYEVQATGSDFATSRVNQILFLFLVLVGIIGDLFSYAGKIGIEKDWVVVIAGEDREMLANLNATLRRIDLFCKFVAPLAFGVLTAIPKEPWNQLLLGTGIVFGWNLLTTSPIYFAWRSVYMELPELQGCKPQKPKMNFLLQWAQGGKAYLSHRAFVPSLAYCCLYFTVLSDHHPLTTAFLKNDGVTNWALGLSRGGGAIAGILGTYLFPCANKKLGLTGTSLVAAWAFAACIDPISSLYTTTASTHSVALAYSMLTAIVVSRTFLWMFDLANVQVLQESVSELERGQINSMQGATCQFMELLMSALAIPFADDFRVLFFASAGGVTMAAVLLTLWGSCCRRHDEFADQPGKVAPLLA